MENIFVRILNSVDTIEIGHFRIIPSPIFNLRLFFCSNSEIPRPEFPWHP